MMNKQTLKLDPFYPIFDSYQWIERFLPLGIKLVQLRIKDKSQDEIKTQIQQAKALTDATNCQLIINDHWQLAIDLGCNFIHLGQEDLEQADIKKIRQHNIKIGFSTHSMEELETALKLDPDYIALGPVYPTILKKMPWKPQGLKRISQWRQAIGEIPLIGIGGFNIDRAAGAFDAGANVVAAVTDITLHQDPQRRVKQWMDLTRQYL